ncbi:MAG: hypothetical protein ACTSWP_01065 [Candidatus Freyarchaeota archaeon]|nr:hypothetical protein [Candidatus Freyrarchaeum guaymaensis]
MTWVAVAYWSGQALTSAMLLTTVVPWTACLILFTVAYKFYPVDKQRLHLLLEERRKALESRKS